GDRHHDDEERHAGPEVEQAAQARDHGDARERRAEAADRDQRAPADAEEGERREERDLARARRAQDPLAQLAQEERDVGKEGRVIRVRGAHPRSPTKRAAAAAGIAENSAVANDCCVTNAPAASLALERLDTRTSIPSIMCPRRPLASCARSRSTRPSTTRSP